MERRGWWVNGVVVLGGSCRGGDGAVIGRCLDCRCVQTVVSMLRGIWGMVPRVLETIVCNSSARAVEWEDNYTMRSGLRVCTLRCKEPMVGANDF